MKTSQSGNGMFRLNIVMEKYKTLQFCTLGARVLDRGMKCQVVNMIHTETIKRLSLPRRPGVSKESTSAGLISDLHHNRSCLPLFSLLSFICSYLLTEDKYMSSWEQSEQTLQWYYDKWSGVIIGLSLMAWQLIKALQGCIIRRDKASDEVVVIWAWLDRKETW